MAAKPKPVKRRTTTEPRRSAQLDLTVVDEAAGARDRVTAVLAQARSSGLSVDKSSRISGRVSPKLIARAKASTGITSDTVLVEFALANIALEDRFLQVFREVEGSVDPDLDLEF